MAFSRPSTAPMMAMSKRGLIGLLRPLACQPFPAPARFFGNSTASPRTGSDVRFGGGLSSSPFRGQLASFGPNYLRTFAVSRSTEPVLSTHAVGIYNGQRRGFLSSSTISHKQLARAEEQANRDPSNANAQNAFYSLLMRANMPGIIMERHDSGHFASNAFTMDMYKKAASMRGLASVGAIKGSNAQSLQAASAEQGIQQAVVAASNNGIRGDRAEPIHVVVQESTLMLIFRWARFLLTFAAVTYISFALVTIIIEAFSSFARRGSPAKADAEIKAEKHNTRFTDVHGCDEAKDELQEVVEFLRNPENFSSLGAKLPKGVLLVGPPGTGKTLLARAVAGEAGVPFFYMSGSEFDEIFVGVGAKRIRELFQAAKARSPAIIFIDELDAIGGKRNARDPSYAKQTLNQLLTELDGFEVDTKIIIIGATNLPSALDKALTRPGRFDRHITVDLPDVRGRLAILKHYAKKIKMNADVNLDSLAARTVGQSGAELENVLNLAALRASRAKQTAVSKKDIDWAYDRVVMGSDKKSMVVTEKEKEMTAYHEAGHALVQLFDKESSSKLYKVTILPKGSSLGHTAHVPQIDKYSYTAAEYMSMIRVLLGGKMAEEMQYGDDKVTSGVSSDLARATDLSFRMVTLFGMSHVLGPVEYDRRYEHLSSETRALIEGEVKSQLKKSYEDVRNLLTEKRKELDLLASALVEYETLDKSEVEKVIRGEKLPGRMSVPKGPMVVKIPTDNTSDPPDIGGISPQPPARPPPPTPAASD